MSEASLSGHRGGSDLGAAWQEARAYLALLKPGVMSLVVFSGVAGLVVAPGTLHPLLAAIVILAIAVGSGAAGAINMVYDRDIDALMYRTRDRPLVTGQISPESGLAFGIALAVGAVAIMGLAAGWLAAGLLAVAIFYYVAIYTMWLKRRTPQNIVIGGAAGAFPPVIGWTAVTGSLAWEPWLLFALIFFWTPPHFWALGLYTGGDYKRAGVPMLPVVAGVAATRRQILAYTLILVPFALAPYAVGMAGEIYLAVAAGLSVLYVASGVDVLRHDGRGGSHKPAKRSFGFSIFYLFALLGALMADAGPGLLLAGGA